MAEALKEGGTLTYKYFVSDDGDVLVLEQFEDVESAHIHITNWDNFAWRWLDAAPGTRMVHLGDLPDELRARHSALEPKLLKQFGGFSRPRSILNKGDESNDLLFCTGCHPNNKCLGC